MRFKLFSLFAASLLIAACESTRDASDSDAGTSGVSGISEEMQDSGMSEEIQVEEINPRSAEYVTEVLGDTVYFDFDSSVISARAQGMIERWAEWMNDYGDIVVIVEGHADERGTREYNLALGERRANAIKNYLVALGVDPGRITNISFGKERPAVEGHTEAAWAQNRRGVLVLE
ncbi:MAG: peptidoglycan-associated lipoprotein Pal [Rhodospirillales bacterium]|nr:peptidoglycan-associated lipoprotein Pal [Rhodospirillales bacterium]